MNRLQRGPWSSASRTLSRIITSFVKTGKTARYARLLRKPLEERYRGVSGHFMEGLRERLIKPGVLKDADQNFAEKVFSQYYGRVRSDRDLNRMLFVDTNTWLPDDLLVKADKMTMAASVELRVPFLDHRLVEFAARLPISLKIRHGQTKYLLKKVMEPYLPHDVIYRPKKGFPVPVSDWFKHGLYEMATELLLNSKSHVSGFIDLVYLRSLMDQHRAGKHDFSNELWGLLVLEWWFRTFEVQL